jgi:hypothetical protein
VVSDAVSNPTETNALQLVPPRVRAWI